MDSPRGRIYLMKSLAEGRIALDDDAARHLDLCLGCRGCETACPSGVHYGQLIEGARSFVERNHRRGFVDRLKRRAVSAIFPYPNRLRALLAPLKLVDRLAPETCSESHHAAHDSRLARSPSAARSELAPTRHDGNHRAARRCTHCRRASRMRRASACEFGKPEQRSACSRPPVIASFNSNRPHAAEHSICIRVTPRELAISSAPTFAR